MSTDDSITTILGRGSSFDGKLTFDGAVRIDGRFSGEIETEGTLIVGESAEVRAEIKAAHVVVEGVVQGDITATDALEIHAPARVSGNLTTPNLSIEKGSIFQGSCKMQDEEARAPLTNGRSKKSAEATA
jgi:cytoskeletal protein CcmA (bactofilin family)